MPDFENINMEDMEKAMSEGSTATIEEAPIFEAPEFTETGYHPETAATTETAEPVVEAPAAAEIPPADKVSETQEPAAEAPKTIEVEKIVEKIVEKHPEFKNETSKALFEQLTNAEDPKAAQKTVLEYLREKDRDYTTMSDMDVVKAALRKENPTWTKDDVDLKMRRTYGKNLTPIDLNSIDQDIDPDKYEKAEQHNEEVSNALADLRLDALRTRPTLIKQQEELELPTIKPAQQQAEPTGPTPEQIEVANQAWKKAVDDALPTISEIKQTIDDKEVVYSLNEDDKKSIKESMENFNLLQYSQKRGWQNEDGTPNVSKLAEDVLKLENFDKIAKSYATQIKTEATKDVLKSIKNVEDVKRPSSENMAGSFADAFFDAMDKKN